MMDINAMQDEANRYRKVFSDCACTINGGTKVLPLVLAFGSLAADVIATISDDHLRNVATNMLAEVIRHRIQVRIGEIANDPEQQAVILQ